MSDGRWAWAIEEYGPEWFAGREWTGWHDAVNAVAATRWHARYRAKRALRAYRYGVKRFS